MSEVELKWFVGQTFQLTAVQTEALLNARDECDNIAIFFTLDGVTYRAEEDPSDGYRSMLNSIHVDTNVQLKNTFPAHAVVAKWSPVESDDVVEFVDAVTGKVVLEVGTSNYDDYYPCFVGHFIPEHLMINQANYALSPPKENVPEREPEPELPSNYGVW